MRNIFLLLPIVLLFTSCANLSLDFNKQKNEKQILISKANDGDIKAMLKLNEIYLFPQTKEGLDLYNKWLDLVLENENINDILEIKRVYYKYRKMFINGEDIQNDLLYRAKELGSQEALFMLIMNKLRQNDMARFHKKLIQEKNQNDLITLYKAYIFLAQKQKANEVKKFITKSDKEFYDGLYLDDKFYFLNIAYYNSRQDDKEFKRIIKENLEKEDLELINDTGIYLYKKVRALKDAKAYFEKALELNTKNSDIYFYLADIYERFRQDKKLIEKTLKKAISMDNYEAAKSLLKRYKKQKEIKKYLELKKELLKLNNAKRALASFLYENKKTYEAYSIYEELAKDGDKKAILFLAREQKAKEYEFNPEKNLLIEKNREIILKGNEPYLRSDLKFFQRDEKLKNEIIQIELDENNLKTLKEIAYKYYGKKSHIYFKKAADLGDMEAKYLSASALDFDEKIVLYKELIKLGDKKAYKKLALLYKNKGAIKNIKKIVKLYEKAYEAGDKTVIDNIIGYYICPECKMLNDEKVQYYVNEAIIDENVDFILRLARSYKYGKIAKKDMKKALKYFQIAYELRKDKKTKKEIENIKNEGEK